MATSMIARRQRGNRGGFRFRQPFAFSAAQAERRVEIGAHQVVLELSRFVQRRQQVLAARSWRGSRVGHGSADDTPPTARGNTPFGQVLKGQYRGRLTKPTMAAMNAGAECSSNAA